jgi:hypothetical protein
MKDEVLLAILINIYQSRIWVQHPYLGNDILTGVFSQKRRTGL